MSESSNQPRFCTNCGNQLRTGVRFCSECGADVSPLPFTDHDASATQSIGHKLGKYLSSLHHRVGEIKTTYSARHGSALSGNAWRGIPRKLLGWFKDLPSSPKLLVAGFVFLLLAFIFGPLLRAFAIIALVISVAIFAVQVVKGRPLRSSGVAIGASLLLIPVFGFTSNVLYEGPADPLDQGSAVSDQYGYVDEDSGTLYLPNGITSTMPDGWTIATEETYGEAMVYLIPTAYDDLSDNTIEVAKQQAIIQVREGLTTACEVSEPSVSEYDDSREIGGYDRTTRGDGTMAFDEAIIAGESAQAYTDYSATAWRWFYDASDFYPYITASDYPQYSTSLSLNVCSEELNLKANLFIVELPFGGSESEEGSVEPTYDNNATLTSTRLETRDELRERYSDNIGAFLEILENAEDDGWQNNSDLSDIRLSIEDIDENLEDPFLGELEDSSNQ